MPDWIREKLWLWANRSPRGYEGLTGGPKPFGIGSWITIGQRSGYSGAHNAARDLEAYKFESEADQVAQADALRMRVINVDEFDFSLDSVING